MPVSKHLLLAKLERISATISQSIEKKIFNKNFNKQSLEYNSKTLHWIIDSMQKGYRGLTDTEDQLLLYIVGHEWALQSVTHAGSKCEDAMLMCIKTRESKINIWI